MIKCEKKVSSRASRMHSTLRKLRDCRATLRILFCVCKLLSSEANEKICFGVGTGRELRELLKNRIGQGVPQSDPPNFLLERDKEKDRKEVENGTVRIGWEEKSLSLLGRERGRLPENLENYCRTPPRAREIVRVADEKGDPCEKKCGCNFRAQRDRCGCRTSTSGDRSSRVARKVSIR